jgi:hypothetical protein
MSSLRATAASPFRRSSRRAQLDVAALTMLMECVTRSKCNHLSMILELVPRGVDKSKII